MNRSLDTPGTLNLTLAGSFAGYRPVEHRVLRSDDPGLQNTEERPDAVTPRDVPVGGHPVLQPVSWNVVRLRPALD